MERDEPSRDRTRLSEQSHRRADTGALDIQTEIPERASWLRSRVGMLRSGDSDGVALARFFRVRVLSLRSLTITARLCFDSRVTERDVGRPAW